MKRIIYIGIIAFIVMTALLLMNTRREIDEMKDITATLHSMRVSLGETQSETLLRPETTATIKATKATTAPAYRVGRRLTVKVRAYCTCTTCTRGLGITSTGTVPVQGRTLAVDPGVIPHGSAVVIGGVEYVAEDTIGGKGYMVEIYFDSHEDARAYGVRREDVIVYE